MDSLTRTDPFGHLNKKLENEKEKLEFLSEINKYIDKSLEWFKDILKTIVKMIVVAIIGSIGEIYHLLNELCIYNIITNEKISILFKDEIFSTIYILLLISSFPYNIKEMYRKIVGINNNLDNLTISLDSI